MVAILHNVTSYEQHKQIDGQENGHRRHCRTHDSTDKVADKCGCDHNGTRCNDSHGYRVQELPLRQPSVIENDTLMKKRYDGQTAAESERTCLYEERAQLSQSRKRDG